MIFFSTAQLGETVHTIPGGFTNLNHQFVEAESNERACELHAEWVRRKGVLVRRVSAGVAIHQVREKYTFPESIITEAMVQAMPQPKIVSAKASAS